MFIGCDNGFVDRSINEEGDIKLVFDIVVGIDCEGTVGDDDDDVIGDDVDNDTDDDVDDDIGDDVGGN